MRAPRFLIRGFSRDPARFREGERSWSAWWAKFRAQVPANAWAALTALAATVIGFIAVGPLEHPSRFYEIAAQVMPAFLIALAVERSLLDSLGTKADFARTRREETVDSYAASGLNEGVRNSIEFALLQRQTLALHEDHRDLLNVPIAEVDIAKAAVVGHWHDDAMIWKVFRGLLHDEFGLAEDDHDFFEERTEWMDPSPAFDAIRESVLSAEPGPAIRWLAARAALREKRDSSGGLVGSQLVAAELNHLFAAQKKSELASILSRVTYRANLEYDSQRKRRTLSLRISIVLLTVTELLALVGLMSPGRPYAGLFVIAAGLVVASVMNVAGGALADLADSRGL